MKPTIYLAILTLVVITLLNVDEIQAHSAALEECINKCAQRCPDKDVKRGCNQMYSCAHACKIRDLGLDHDTCKAKCRRKLGCRPNVNGFKFNLCKRCNPDRVNPEFTQCTKMPTIDECKTGCGYYDAKSNTKPNTCAGKWEPWGCRTFWQKCSNGYRPYAWHGGIHGCDCKCIKGSCSAKWRWTRCKLHWSNCENSSPRIYYNGNCQCECKP